MTIQTPMPTPVKRGVEHIVGHDEAVSRSRDWAIAAERLIHEAVNVAPQTSPAGRIDLANAATGISRAWSAYAITTEEYTRP